MVATNKLHALELSLTIGCCLDCLYCPQRMLLNRYYADDKNRKKRLEFEDFKIALEKVQDKASISFCGMSEPFLNPECADMIVYAYQKGYKINLLTTLVGMSFEDFEKIKDIEFESFVLHIPDQEKHSKFVITNDYLELLRLVNTHIKIDYYSCHGSVHEDVKNYIDAKKYAGIDLGNRAGNLEINGINDFHHKGKIICYHGSEAQVGGWTPVMLPDGDLVLCCQDYGMKHVLGNLLTQSWDEIEKGDECKKYKKGLNDESIDLLCRRCSDAKQVELLPAIQLKKAVTNVEREKIKNEYMNDMIEFIENFAKSKTICVFGLGKLWRDHFYQEYWHEGLGVNLFCDNNSQFHNTNINGILCVSPDKLQEYKDLLVIVFVKNGDSIINQIKEMGINNCILIEQVFEKCNELCDGKFKKITI